MVGRIIARPYVGYNGAFSRTAHRHDYAVSPLGNTALDDIKSAGLSVIAIGKICDIFNGQGITESISTKNNMDGVDQLIIIMNKDFNGLCFTNLVDFDALYGHRRDPVGYAAALEEFDARIPEILASMKKDDLLLITADHGNDPTFGGTDHTREYVPLLAYAHSMTSGGILKTGYFSDVAATIRENFSLSGGEGTSILHCLK